jgi:hypothetical protein
MKVSAAFIRHPVATMLIMAAIFLVGVVAPVTPLPQVDFPTIQVSAALPGASPDDGILRLHEIAVHRVMCDLRRLVVADDRRECRHQQQRTLDIFGDPLPVRAPRAPSVTIVDLQNRLRILQSGEGD